MRTSTLQKLPVPFMAVCGLGIGIVGFLMLQSDGEATSRTAAQRPTVAATPRQRPVANRSAKTTSNRYRPGKPVAKLNRPGGNNYRPVKKSGAQVARDRSDDVRIISPHAYVPELKPAIVVAQENAARKAAQVAAEQAAAAKIAAEQLAAAQVVAEQLAAAKLAAEQLAAKQVAAALAAAEQVAAAEPSPVRRDADAIKTTTVAATRTDNTYSPSNPDPSELLSKVLGDDTPAAAEPTEPADEVAQTNAASDIKESIVLPPVVDMAGPELADDRAVEESRVVKKDPAPAATPAPAESVVAGELQPERDTLADKIAIRNPKDNMLPVSFVANRHKIQLKPGQQFVYPATEELEVRFARGGTLGADKVVMREGDWNFSVTRQAGWKLTPFN